MSIQQAIQDYIHKIQYDSELQSRFQAIRPKFNELGYDNWGMHFDTVCNLLTYLQWVYQQYFKVSAFGLENIPNTRVMLVANHSGKLPWDAMLIAYSVFRYLNPPRILRTMADHFMPLMPFINTWLMRCGQILGEPNNCRILLEDEEAVLIFPEGTKGSGKLYWHRYELQKFGTDFIRLALQTKTPIIPVAVVGAEETYPTLYNANCIARLLGLPFFPITPFWPWFGIVGLLPIPTKIQIIFGEPIYLTGDFDGPDSDIQNKSNTIKRLLHNMIQQSLQTRKKILS